MKRYLLFAAIGMAFIPIQFDIKNIVDKLTSYSLKYPQEKIFLHFDKPHYSMEETVWFKAYLVDAFSNEPTALSKVIYVELFNSNLEQIDKKMLNIENGGAAGDFLLPDSIPPGTYHIRAYTNWMRNFDEAFFFRHSFNVFETQDGREYKRPDVEPKLTFFPEGGDLIENISSIVAVKATDQFGKGIDVKGEILGTSGEIITTLETDERGMGAIIITPKRGQKQTARIRFNEELFDFDLPEVQEDGYALKVINNFQSEKINIAVTSQNKSLANSGIVAHHSGEVFYSALNQGNENAFAIRLDRKDFPSGICHITFFDPEGIPQAERLVYVNYPKTKDIKLTKNVAYKQRSLVSLGLDVSDSLMETIPSNLSISITPRDLVEYADNGENIINYLQLTSDLVGEIEEPNTYLRLNKQSFRSLDLLLLTQGWRRFKWEDVLGFHDDKKPEFWAEEGITFSGKVVDHYNRKIGRSSRVSLSILNDEPSFVVGETDIDGNFFFSGMDFYDSTSLLIQADRKLKKKGKYSDDVYIKLIDLSDPEVALDKYSLLHRKIEKSEQYQSISRRIDAIEEEFTPDADAILLDEVQVSTFRDPFDDPFERVFKIYTEPTQRVVVDSLMRGVPTINIFEVLRRIPGVLVKGSFPRQTVRIGGIGSLSGGKDPIYIYDGVYISRVTLLTLPSTNISHIDILKGPDAAIYGSQGANGVVAIYSKTGMGVVSKKPKKMGVLAHSHPGYSKVREFFSPNYAVPLDEHAKPDFRTTLYWNPTIMIEGDKPSTAEFYSSDQKGTFDIIIQGITVDGVPIFLKDSLIVE